MKKHAENEVWSIREHSQNFGEGLLDPVPNYVQPPLRLYKFVCVCVLKEKG